MMGTDHLSAMAVCKQLATWIMRPFLPVQEDPSPVYPGLHVHTNPSSVSIHCALLSQSSVPRLHSLISVLLPEDQESQCVSAKE